MRYLYKKNKANIYKRRIPNTQAFFSFNTNIYNIKNAQKFVIIFNRLSHDLWNYLRLGKQMDFNLREIYEILEDYKTKATEEYIRLKNKKQHKNYEELRHEHLKKLFPIKKHDPILGEITLNGADKKVLKTAKESFKNLAVGSYNDTKTHLKKIGKEITARGTDELKSLYAKMRNCKDERQFLDFLSMLLKTEAEILKIDEQRAKNRFGDSKTTVKNDEIVEDKRGFTSQELEKNKSIEEIQEYFLTTSCGYTKEQLEDSKNSAYKQKKVCDILKDLLEDNNEYTADFITFNRLKEVLHIIPKIPRKTGNITGAYSYYLCYKNKPNSTKEELRSSTSTRKDLSSLKRYIDFLELKEYISLKEKRELEELIKTSNLATNKEVIKGERTATKNKAAFKDSMLKAIFNRQNRPYKIVFDKLENEKLKDNKDLLVARFYAPLLMFFTGSRLAEIVQLKVQDCEIREDNMVWLYIEANEQKGSKTAASKRIIPVHDFLSQDLNLLNFIKKAQNEKREYLFNTLAKDEDKISKEFNRHKDFLLGNLGKEDIFQNSDYTLYSFRHTYKTHLENLGVNETVINKLQGHTVDKVVEGYFSINDEVVENVNKFKKHEIVEDWSDFIKLSESLSNY